MISVALPEPHMALNGRLKVTTRLSVCFVHAHRLGHRHVIAPPSDDKKTDIGLQFLNMDSIVLYLRPLPDNHQGLGRALDG